MVSLTAFRQRASHPAPETGEEYILHISTAESATVLQPSALILLGSGLASLGYFQATSQDVLTRIRLSSEHDRSWRGYCPFQLFFSIMSEYPVANCFSFSPRHFSMMLIVIGVVALVLATIQHRRQLEMLKVEYKSASASTAGIVAGPISVMGLLAILAVIFRL